MRDVAYGKNDMIEHFVRDYAEKLFYFCLKKTGDSYEAEDLSSDIMLNVVTALNKGIVPEHFSAWVWQIARNRYSVWADRKHKHVVSVSDTDIGDIVDDERDIADASDSVENILIHSEQLSLLRRELSFISSDYRNIVVAYYINGIKISDISKYLGLPQGTVLTRLHRARNILREGMNMAREFGKRSYNPEMITFCSTGYQPSGLPWSAIARMKPGPVIVRDIPVNILCEAHNNPCTVRELALELGIAVPYMENEVELLVQAELLKRLDNGKYLTNFFISPKECQNEINEMVCDFAQQHAELYWKLAEKAYDKAVAIGITAGDYSENDATMYFAFYVEQQMLELALPASFYSFKRADGGTWGIMGYESGSFCRLPEAFFNDNGNRWMHTMWRGYDAHAECSIFQKKRYEEDVPDSVLNPMLEAVAKGIDDAEFSKTDKINLNKLIEQGFCAMHEDGNVIVNAIVFHDDMKTRLNEYLSTLPDFNAVLKDMKKFLTDVKAVVARYANTYIQDDFEYYVSMSVVKLRPVLACLWKDSGCYKGDFRQFCSFSY